MQTKYYRSTFFVEIVLIQTLIWPVSIESVSTRKLSAQSTFPKNEWMFFVDTTQTSKSKENLIDLNIIEFGQKISFTLG